MSTSGSQRFSRSGLTLYWSLYVRVLVDVDHSTLGNITLPGPPLRFFDPDGTEVTETRHTAPPVLGEDTDEVMSWLHGLTR